MITCVHAMGDVVRPRVLVLLAAFNGARWIEQQIESILAQTDVEVRLIVSDDGSSDETVAVVKTFLCDSRVELVSPSRPTGSAGQNFFWLVRHCPSDGFEYVSFSDQDDIWNSNKLSQGCNELRSTNAVGYSCAVTAFWENGRRKILRQTASVTVSDFLFEGAGQGCTYMLEATFYSRVREFCLAKADLTRSLRYHDWTVYALARCWRMSWCYDPSSMVEYRQHASNDTGAKNSFTGVYKRYLLIKSGWYAREISGILEICIVAAPHDDRVGRWAWIMRKPRSFMRNARVAQFCIQGGRRRWLDNSVLILAGLAGWV